MPWLLAFVAQWLGKSALMQSPIGGFLRSVPASVWRVIGWVAIVASAFLLHQHFAHKAVADAYAKGKADEAAQVEAKAIEIKSNIDQLSAKISNLIRSRTDAENAGISDAAVAIRVRGPGRAVCPGTASLPAAASGPEPTPGPAGTAVARVPYPEWQQLLAVPFTPTVDFAKGHDQCQVDLAAYRERDAKLIVLWNQTAKQLADAKKKLERRGLLQRLNPF